MAWDLCDFRGKITKLTWVYLEADHRAGEGEHQEILRKVMHEWAERKHRAGIEAHKLLQAEGLPGNSRDSEGTSKT